MVAGEARNSRDEKSNPVKEKSALRAARKVVVVTGKILEERKVSEAKTHV